MQDLRRAARGRDSRRWAEHGITANACAPGFIHTNLVRHLGDATMRAMGSMDADGNLITPDYCKTPAPGAATTVLPAASPPLAGVTGRCAESAFRPACAGSDLTAPSAPYTSVRI
ncbi:hypothetical protein [Streptomyces sp. NPDC048521]|uniref:hypothetical protein n=1 Tax=Streptomyces sp. NPDC048521 TaxID=3365566 RepID=UPI0037144C18